jgi:hypothetical protein
MSEVALFKGAALPAFAKRNAGTGATAGLTGGTAGSGQRISIKGGVFRLLSNGEQIATIEDRYLDVVVVAASPNYTRTFYAGKYVEGNTAPPDCWSVDGKKPDASVAEPQSSSCEGCPQNVKGSGEGDSRACRFSQRLAVKLANDIEGGSIMQLSIPATSIFGKADGDKMGLQAYARYLAAQGYEANMFVTRMKFDTLSDASHPKLLFRPMRWLTEDEYAIVAQDGESPEAKAAITMTVAQTDKVAGAPALPARGQPIAAPEDDEDEPPAPAPKKSKAKPVAEVEEDAEDAPPTKRATSTSSASAPAKSKLAQIAAEWDED